MNSAASQTIAPALQCRGMVGHGTHHAYFFR